MKMILAVVLCLVLLGAGQARVEAASVQKQPLSRNGISELEAKESEAVQSIAAIEAGDAEDVAFNIVIYTGMVIIILGVVVLSLASASS